MVMVMVMVMVFVRERAQPTACEALSVLCYSVTSLQSCMPRTQSPHPRATQHRATRRQAPTRGSHLALPRLGYLMHHLATTLGESTTRCGRLGLGLCIG